MSKYKVGDELIVIDNPCKETDKLKELTYLNINFNHQMVLEKALLRAFQNEIINISVFKNNNVKQ